MRDTHYGGTRITDTTGGMKVMKTRRAFLFAWVLMLIISISFVVYALGHPEGSFPWNLSVTYALYGIYFVVMAACFVTWLVMTIRQRTQRKNMNKAQA